MTTAALSEEALRKSLLDIRLPAEDATMALADLLLAAGVGGVAALVAIAALRLVSRRKSERQNVSLTDRVAALQALPEDARRVGFLHLLREIAPERHAALQPELYRADTACDPEAEVLARV